MSFRKLTPGDLKRKELEEKIRAGEIDKDELTPAQKKLLDGGKK